MDDEIKDMFFRLFLLKTIKSAKKGRLHRFFRIFAVRGVRLTFRDRPSLNPQLHRWVFCCELLSGAYLCVHYCLAL